MQINTPEDLDQLGYIGAITELEPSAGPMAAICPPTFQGGKSTPWIDRIAITNEMTIPSREHGWADVVRDQNGTPRKAPAVLINSLGAEAHQLGAVLRAESGINWGRIAVKPWDQKRAKDFFADPQVVKILQNVPAGDPVRDVATRLLTETEYDSWSASHRIADAVIRYAEESLGSQVWEGARLKALLLDADPRRDVDWLWCNAANAVIFGFWLSITGNGVNPRWARAVTSEVFGYGVLPLRTGAAKGSDIGDVSKKLTASTKNGGGLQVAVSEGSGARKEGGKPSNFGLGKLPGTVDYTAVSCELILRRSGISLTHLRQIKSGSKESASVKEEAIVRAAAAAGLYALAVVSKRNVFLRSGTDLSPLSTTWTGRTIDGSKVTLDVDVARAKRVLAAAMDAASQAGVAQGEEIPLTLSREFALTIVDSTVKSDSPVADAAGD